MGNDLISIIVPIYNVEEYLQRCIDSLINQTYHNTEIILVDDGSTDNCGTISDQYSRNYDNVYSFHKKNGGLSDARNYGITKAHGKYICFIDSDDYIDKRYCEILYKNIIDANADISICEFLRVTDDTISEMCEYKNEIIEIYDIGIEKQRNILNELNEITTVAWNKLYKIKIWKNIKYPKDKLNEDEFVIHYLLDKCDKIVYTNLKMYYYYQRNNSIMMSKYNERKTDVVEAFCDRLNFYKNKIEYNSLVPRAYEVFMKMIITHYGLSKESDNIAISNRMIERYKKEYDKTITKKLGLKSRIQLLSFYYLPNLYYLVKKGIINVRKYFRKDNTET